jgi:hypothetical protein
MKLTLFQSDQGDCLLVTSSDGKTLLVDGGMRSSYTEHVAPQLAKLKKLDLVCVSHIDRDHISGVLQMLDDEVVWRVHDFQVKSGNTKHKKPSVVRPPAIAKIWHNGFSEQVSQNTGPIAGTLAALSNILAASDAVDLRRVADEQRELATSIPEAIQLSRRIGDGQLGIPLNPERNGALMVAGDGGTIKLGKLKISVIGPFEADLKKLRTEWNKWLRDKKEELKRLQQRARADEERLGTDLDRLLGDLALAARELGDRKKVTTPNLASLMLYVEENGRSLILTGDGHWQDIDRGLADLGKVDGKGKLHVDVLKVQHHGSEHNITEEFCERITANDYVFCGNGAHENPDLDAVQALVAGRRKAAAQNGIPKKFKLWFNSSSTVPGKDDDREHMGEVEKLVGKLSRASKGAMTAVFQTASHRTIAV